MSPAELHQLIAQGEDSGVEFKRDDIDAEKLAREMCAFANLRGGVILLGVEDNGVVSGLRRADAEEWVMEIARTKLSPPLIPHFSRLTDAATGQTVAVIAVPAAVVKPCRVLHSGRRTAYVRVGSTVREPGDDELAAMYQASLRLNYGKTPVASATPADLHRGRLRDYLERTLGYAPAASDDELHCTLLNLELLAETGGVTVPSVNGMLLFGKSPRRHLPQSGIRAIAYRGAVESYDAIEDLTLDAPLVPEFDADGRLAEPGLIERAMAFVARHCPPVNPLEGARNLHNSAFPDALLREVFVNAVAHRDYTLAGTDILLTVFADRLEIKSPGRLPNGATVEALRRGFRYYRNQILVNVLRDLRYIDARGMGLRLKVIPMIRELTGREPDFLATDTDFTVVLPRL